MRNNKFILNKRRLLFDWHIPPFFGEINIDKKEYIEKIIETKTNCVVLITKSAFGCSYYNTKIGIKNQALKMDILKEIGDSLKLKGVQVIAYYNVCCDVMISEKYPNWRQIDILGNPGFLFGYKALCMNSPYREIVFAQLKEIISNYNIDGIWLDIVYFINNGCFCDFCKNRFKKIYGEELKPEKVNIPDYKRFFENFKKDSVYEFFKEVRDLIKSKNLLLTGNHTGDFWRDDPRLSEICDFNTVEFHPPYYKIASTYGCYFQKKEKPFEMMIPEGLHGWGDWTVIPEKTLCTMISQVVSRGGAPCIGHVVYPYGDYSGKVAKGVWDLIKTGWKWEKKIETFCQDTEPVPVSAVLYSLKEDWQRWRATQGLELKWTEKIFGISSIFLEEHVIFDILNGSEISKIKEYEFIYLPDVHYLTENEVESIRRYIENGGKAIISLSFFDYKGLDGIKVPENFYDLIGAQILKEFPFTDSYIYISENKIKEGLPEIPILIRSAPNFKENIFRPLCIKVFSNNTKILGYLIEPKIESRYDDKYPYCHIYHQHAPPNIITKYPAIIYNKIGKGKIVFVTFPLEICYYYRRDPNLRRLLFNLMKYIGVPNKIKIEGPKNMEVILRQKKEKWIIHFIQIFKENDTNFITETLCKSVIKCKINGNFKEGYLPLKKKSIKLYKNGNLISFTFNSTSFHEIVILE